MKVSGIYALVNKINNKIYIGQSVDIVQRLREHKCHINLNLPLPNAIKKYGWDGFHKIVLEYIDVRTLSIEDARQTLNYSENLWINYFDKLGCYKYNIRPAAESNFGIKHSDEYKEQKRIQMLGNKHGAGHKMSEETKEILRERMLNYRHSEETKKKISDGNKGKKFSDESRKKMSAKARGKYISPETKNKISKTLKGRPQSQSHVAKRLAAVVRTESGRFMKKMEN